MLLLAVRRSVEPTPDAGIGIEGATLVDVADFLVVIPAFLDAPDAVVVVVVVVLVGGGPLCCWCCWCCGVPPSASLLC